jgi:hypothetical protein
VNVIAEIGLGDMSEKVHQSQNQRQDEDGYDVEVERRVPASVIRQILGFGFGHERLLA